ncbi:MAG: YdcF family protein [Bdellovibrio sp.]
MSWQKTITADCAVVLTGGPGRVREGFDLLANKSVKKLVISGVYSNARLREIMPAWSFYGSLNENDVVLDRRSETTFGNAQQSLPIVEALNCRDILLVTSRTHMYRAYRTFRATYPENIYIQKHSIIGGRYETSVWETSFEAIKSLFYSFWAY